MFSTVFNKVFGKRKNIPVKNINSIKPAPNGLNNIRNFSTVFSKAIKRRVDKIHERIIKKNKNIGRVKEIDNKDRIFYQISDSAYKNPADRKDLGSYIIENNYSDEENVVYINNQKREIIIGHRGSVNRKDFETDLKLTIRGIKTTSRYKRTEKLVENVKAKYPNYKIMFTGHSLGGSIAIENARRFNNKAVVFNAGHTPFIRTNYKDNDITYYTNKGDLVSLMGSNSYKNVKVLDKGGEDSLIKAHSLDSFKPSNYNRIKRG